jgi:hypothetical protein
VPSWSRDGQSIYLGSTRTGTYQIWKMSARGGDPVQVTQHGGTYAKESIDRKYIYHGKAGPLTGVWRVPVAGGEEVEVVARLASYGNFAVASDGLYFEARLPGNPIGHSTLRMKSSFAKRVFCRNPSSCLSHSLRRFQPTNVWLTRFIQQMAQV